MIEVPVYVPVPTIGDRAGRMGGHLLATVAEHSAIVGKPDADGDMIVVYYEGNLYGASNIVTFADRAMLAYYRMRDHYPTTAMMAVPRSQVQRQATLFPEYGRVEVHDAGELVAMARWLGIAIGTGVSDRLASELACSGVRAGA